MFKNDSRCIFKKKFFQFFLNNSRTGALYCLTVLEEKAWKRRR